ncbi:MAG: helix-turn-helix domain-containing protein [Bacteroidia bacterium]|nr:helix-turn-helix domain-containing protein [Bacteroidia bacterium]
MRQKNLPVYNIENFQSPVDEKDFYADYFISHLRHHKFVEAPHKHDFFLVVLFTKGSGIHEIDFTSYPIKPGSVFLLSPGQTHGWKLSADIDGYIFFHSRAFFDINFKSKKVHDFPFFSSSFNSPVIYMKDKSFQKIKKLFLEIISEFKMSALMKQAKLCSLTDLLYIELSRLYLQKKETVIQNHLYLSKIKLLEELVDRNFLKIKSPSDYADRMNMSEKHLNRICKTCLNKTTGDFISDRIILEAKNLLIHSTLSVKEVANKLNYSDSAYFSRLFKKKCGETPLGFAKKYLKE